jgi:hypothetical protein
MAKEAVKKTIDGRDFTFTLMGVSQGMRWAKRIQNNFGPIIARALAAAQSDELNGDQLAGVFESWSQSCSEQQYVDWAKELTETVLLDGRKINFEIDFQGELLLLHKVMIETIKVNFPDFLELVAKDGGLLKRLNLTKT